MSSQTVSWWEPFGFGRPVLQRCLGLLVLMLVGVVEGRGDAASPARAYLGVPPVHFAGAGGITVILHAEEPARTHFRIAVCGREVAALPAGLPLVFRFDVPIDSVQMVAPPAGIAFVVQATAQEVRVVLTRDPFTAPGIWDMMLSMAVGRSPRTVQVTLGSGETHDLIYQGALTKRFYPEAERPRCDEPYAVRHRPAEPVQNL